MNVFLKAAKLVDSGKERYSCNAVRDGVDGFFGYPLLRAYCDWFSDNGHLKVSDFEGSGAHQPTTHPGAKEHRVTALLFMNEIYNDTKDNAL